MGVEGTAPKQYEHNEHTMLKTNLKNGVQIHPLRHGCGDDVGRATMTKEISAIHNQAGGPPSIILHKDLLVPRAPMWVTKSMYKNNANQKTIACESPPLWVLEVVFRF